MFSRKIRFFVVFTILMVVFFSVANAADEQEMKKPAGASIQMVKESYPILDDSQAIIIARLLEIAGENDLIANDSSATDETRAFAVRAKRLALEAAAIQIFALETVPKIKAVLKKIKAEEEAGAKEISADLLPKVKETASTMLYISQEQSSLNSEVVKLKADRVIYVSQRGNLSIPEMVMEFDGAVNTLEKAVNTMKKIGDLLPDALILKYVGHLGYSEQE